MTKPIPLHIKNLRPGETVYRREHETRLKQIFSQLPDREFSIEPSASGIGYFVRCTRYTGSHLTLVRGNA